MFLHGHFEEFVVLDLRGLIRLEAARQLDIRRRLDRDLRPLRTTVLLGDRIDVPPRLTFGRQRQPACRDCRTAARSGRKASGARPRPGRRIALRHPGYRADSAAHRPPGQSAARPIRCQRNPAPPARWVRLIAAVTELPRRRYDRHTCLPKLNVGIAFLPRITKRRNSSTISVGCDKLASPPVATRTDWTASAGTPESRAKHTTTKANRIVVCRLCTNRASPFINEPA